MTLLDLAKKYPTMRKILLRQRGRDLQKEVEMSRREANSSPAFSLMEPGQAFPNHIISNCTLEYAD